MMARVPFRYRVPVFAYAVILALLGAQTPATAGSPYIRPEPQVTYLVKGAWYDSDAVLLNSMSGSYWDNTVRVSNASLLRTGWTIEVVSDHGPVPERMIIDSILSECDNATDDDADTLVNEGCLTVDDGIPHPESGAQCDNATDDDGDGKVNDGCPTVDDGVPNPETGAQCVQGDTEDQDHDGYVNDGCPPMDPGGTPLPETGAECDNNWDDDDDLKTNDGCPTVGDPETGDACYGNYDDDDDGKINDGCPAAATPEGGAYCADVGETGLADLDDDDDGYANDGCLTIDIEYERDITELSPPILQCQNSADDDADGKVNDGCPQYDVEPETGAACSNAVDDDADGKVNDGCPADGPEAGSKCSNAIDDDGDGRVNDGCSADGAEKGTQCYNSLDDDGDGYVNDGCPKEQGESGDRCFDALDDDTDGMINDGCPLDGVETGAQCSNAVDDDGDGYVNDGCPAQGTAESYCHDAIDNDADGKVNDGCPERQSGDPEPGFTACANAIDDDGDGRVNDGCPIQSAAEVYDACSNSIDDDNDFLVNDGCPSRSAPETYEDCSNATDDDGDGRVNDGCPYKESYIPDTVVVTRWVNGVADSHTAGAPIRDHIVKAELWVRDIPIDHVYGVGGFDLSLSFNPQQLEYLQMTLDLTWLQSTGRSAYCNGPTAESGLVTASCWTAGDPINPPWPKGAIGSGRLATVWFKVTSPDSLIVRNVSLSGSQIFDISSATISAALQNGFFGTILCPDANLDTRINAFDASVVWLSVFDRGQNSGATLAASIDNAQTTLPVSGLGSLAAGQVIAIDNEAMLINAVSAGPPATIEVTRGIYASYGAPARPHNAGTGIYIANVDGNGDGRFGYTDPKDTNNDLTLNVLDVKPIFGVLNTWCPQ